MRGKGQYSLKKAKLRQSWHKYNLYNLSRAEPPIVTTRTFFQQKWTAKSTARAYHGETVREKHWQRMFRRRLRAVVPMDHTDLARSDGYEHAEGRGSGLELHPSKKPSPFPKTPYMNMTFAPLERRLDTAIFRAMFASSTRQARQFVTHGDVKVNGKKMIYPGYQLNPGDMFQVEPERVLFATGAPKDARERRAGRLARRKAEASKDSEDPTSDSPTTTAANDQVPTEPEAPPDEASTKETLKSLLSQARSLLTAPSSSTTLSAKRKQDLRAFQRTLKRTLSRPNEIFAQKATNLTDSIDAQLQELAQKLNLNAAPPPPENDRERAAAARDRNPETLTVENSSLLRQALAEARENPIDVTKTYATPWRPRPYMSAFAFIPRFLEVHHRICSAVYLRHPVARPGLGEVPTPFGNDTNALAHNWYLRRR
ncbi:MAG: hypothetical protein LQ350_006119 [Teloschistes chrysophthalmus]|nr:MAG: hypothetical protein LQ350_006119 [Niorma chrysophthalma]